MPTLVLRDVPSELHGKLKAAAAAHHRSMNQEAIVALSAAFGAPVLQAQPTTAETLEWLSTTVWPCVNSDARTDDEILGYDADGLPS